MEKHPIHLCVLGIELKDKEGQSIFGKINQVIKEYKK